MYKKMSTTNFG